MKNFNHARFTIRACLERSKYRRAPQDFFCLRVRELEGLYAVCKDVGEWLNVRLYVCTMGLYGVEKVKNCLPRKVPKLERRGIRFFVYVIFGLDCLAKSSVVWNIDENSISRELLLA